MEFILLQVRWVSLGMSVVMHSFTVKINLNYQSKRAIPGNIHTQPLTASICFNPPLLLEIPKCVTPPCPQNSTIVNPPSPSEFPFFLEVHFRLSNAYMNKQTWIYASSRLWSSGARRQALLFSDKKNLPLVARLCKLLFKSEFGYKNKHHLR